jgi:hypothetical protein
MGEGVMALEGGASFATTLFDLYYAAGTQEWTFEKAGPFWEAVQVARDLGRTGRGQTIAVIDTGFDDRICGRENATLAWESPNPRACGHGTAVALLIREVAPEAHLLLCPVAMPGEAITDQMDDALIARAFERVEASAAAIVNLSLGVPLDVTRAEPSAASSGVDWRGMVRHGETRIGAAARHLAGSGRTLIASCGNIGGAHAGKSPSDLAFSPATEPGVFSVGYRTEAREGWEGTETASIEQTKMYLQTNYFDFFVLQPPLVVGSSFASPLFSGFVALMDDRADLPDWKQVFALCGFADFGMVALENQLREGKPPDPETLDLVERFYSIAEAAIPERHRSCLTAPKPCPDCALFGRSVYVNYGLFLLKRGALDAAIARLGAYARINVYCPHGFANLGMACALKAREAQRAGDASAVASHLGEAATHYQRAVALRPDHAYYEARLSEFRAALDAPMDWMMAP